MRPFPVLLVAAALASAASAGPPTGRYRMVGEPDVASEIELRADGHFAYGLAAGALDEQAEGRWTSDGKTVLLTTEPKPRPAEFQLRSSARTADAPLRVKVVWPDGRGIAGVDFRIGFESGEPLEGYTQEYGWTLGGNDTRKPTSVELALVMYGLVSKPFSIDAAHANDLTFTLVPNDLGTADFEQLPLRIEKDGLVMERNGGSLTYKAVGN